MKESCAKLDTCPIIRSLRDRDLPDIAKAIRERCSNCKDKRLSNYYFHVEPMLPITKTNLELLIAGVLDMNPNNEIKIFLDSWIKANNLHPENVRTFQNTAEFEEYYRENLQP